MVRHNGATTGHTQGIVWAFRGQGMAWRIVQQPNGLLARFSDRVDDFTDYNMSRFEAINCCSGYAGWNEAREKVQRGIDAGLPRFEEAIRKIGTAHGKRLARERRYALSCAIEKKC